MAPINTSTDGPDSRGRLDLSEMMTILGRTATLGPEDVGIALSEGDVADHLAWAPEKMAEIAQLLTRTRDRLQSSYAGAAATATAARGPEGWVRQTAAALRPFGDLAGTAETTGAELGELMDRYGALSTIASHAGAVKNAAMDTRAVLGGFGWYVIQTTLAGLRTEVAGKGRAEAEAILAPFVPMLLLLGRFLTDRSAMRRDERAESDRLAAEVQTAREDRDRAEAALQDKGVSPAERTALLSRARSEEPPPAPRRRTRR